MNNNNNNDNNNYNSNNNSNDNSNVARYSLVLYNLDEYELLHYSHYNY